VISGNIDYRRKVFGRSGDLPFCITVLGMRIIEVYAIPGSNKTMYQSLRNSHPLLCSFLQTRGACQQQEENCKSTSAV
jgi:hypothetical protein